VNISEIKTAEPFKNLFPINPKDLTAITENMEKVGYDKSQPVIIWAGKNILVDGHTRLIAAERAGLDDVPVYPHEFASEQEALEYAIHNQRDRRNMTDADILRCIEALDNRQSHGGDRKSGNFKPPSGALKQKSAKQTADILGTSQRKVERTRTVLDHADEKTKQEVKSGRKSIYQAYTETQEKRKQQINDSTVITLNDWKKFGHPNLLIPPVESKSTFNKTNDNIEWAKWTWNPVTGCRHGCNYCYARDIAKRFYEHGFEPSIHPHRLSEPENTNVPAKAKDDIGYRNVFVCSMADLFGEWVPQEWIEAVLKACHKASQWFFLFLTKNPKRLLNINFPDNAWVGTTVDIQGRVQSAEEAFREVKAKVKFLSCEPLLEKLTFSSMEMFDWVIIGGRSRSSQLPALQPKWEWVEHLLIQARETGCKVYFKPNLTVTPKEYPEQTEREKATRK